jgi:hypothetical protein
MKKQNKNKESKELALKEMTEYIQEANNQGTWNGGIYYSLKAIAEGVRELVRRK